MTFDLADPGLLLSDGVLADPRPLYDVLRRVAPVWRIPGQDSYLVTDAVLIREVVAHLQPVPMDKVWSLARKSRAFRSDYFSNVPETKSMGLPETPTA